jgi:uncharacterized membrane protein YgcG
MPRWLLLAAVGSCFQLAACAEDPKYPSITKISDLDNVLTPEQRQKAMQDLEKAQQGGGTDAVKTSARGSPSQ